MSNDNMNLHSMELFLKNIMEKNKYQEYLVKIWLYRESIIVVDFSYFGMSFGIEFTLDKKNKNAKIMVVDRNFFICNLFFSGKARKKTVFHSIDMSAIEDSLKILLDYIFISFTNCNKLIHDFSVKMAEKNKELENSLKVFSRNLNYNFEKWFSEGDLYRLADETIEDTEYIGEVHKKKYKDRPYGFSGLTKKQAFLLELSCLTRINKFSPPITYRHFPQLITYDKNKYTITTTCNGIAINELVDFVEIQNLDEQCDLIVKVLSECNVIHLDDHISGKNIVVNKDGIIALIDFDIAIVDGTVFSLFFETRLASFKKNKEYEGFLSRMKSILRSSKYIIEV